MPSPDDPTLPTASFGNALNVEERLALVRAVDVLLDKWELTDSEKRMLLGVDHDGHLSASRVENVARLSHETLTRLADFLRIHRALRVIFCDPAQCYAWIKRSNEVFFGKSALELMLLNGTLGIARVRAYLEAEVEA